MLKIQNHGKNSPPLHSFCRCTTVAEFDNEVIEVLKRRARDECGNTIYVDSKMKYKEWKEKYVTNDNNSSIINKNANKKEDEMNYLDITSEMYKKAKPKHGKVKKQKFYEYKGKEYFVDGHNVVYKHDERELEVARLLNYSFGGNVKILPNINFPQGIKSPDYIFRGEKIDLKRITSKRVNDCVKTAIRDSEKQAHNFIIDNTLQTVSDEAILKQINEIYEMGKFSWVNTIYVLKNDKFIKIYKRK